MAQIKIRQIFRDKLVTKYGEKESIKIIPEGETVIDVNGDTVKLMGRKISGFRDKNGETDQWTEGMTIKVQIATKKSMGKHGEEMEWVNFRMPDGSSSIVSKGDVVVAVEPDEDW